MSSTLPALPRNPANLPAPNFLTTVYRPLASGAQDIEGYIQPQRQAESAIRATFNRPNTAGNSVTLPTATALDRLSRDLINLSDRGDRVLAEFANQDRVTRLTRDLTNAVDPARLASIGRGPATSTQGPSSTTSERVLVNGTSRFTTVDLDQRTVTRSQISDDQGLVGGVVTVSTQRTVTEAGGNDVRTGQALATVSRFENTEQVIEADVRAGTRRETFAQSAIVTRSDTTDIRAETSLRTVVFRTVDNAEGRFAERVVREDFQAVTTLDDQQTVVGVQERRSVTRTRVNLDTGEVSTVTTTSAVSATVRRETIGEGENAIQRETITVRADQNRRAATVGPAGDGEATSEVRERFNTEAATIVRDTRGETTTERTRTAASTVENRFVGAGETVLAASQRVQTAAASIDSSGRVSASATERRASFQLAPTGNLIDDGFDPTPPTNQVPETATVRAAATRRSVSATIAPNGNVALAAREESVRATPTDRNDLTAGAVVQPVREQVIRGVVPAANALNGDISGLPGSVASPRGSQAVGPVYTPAGAVAIDAQSVNRNGRGPTVSVDAANRTITTTANGSNSGPSARVDGLNGELEARRRGELGVASGAPRATASIGSDGTTVLEAIGRGRANRRPLALQANDTGDLFRSVARPGTGFESNSATPLPQQRLSFITAPQLRLSV
jgi:hypothetical protein